MYNTTLLPILLEVDVVDQLEVRVLITLAAQDPSMKQSVPSLTHSLRTSRIVLTRTGSMTSMALALSHWSLLSTEGRLTVFFWRWSLRHAMALAQ